MKFFSFISVIGAGFFTALVIIGITLSNRTEILEHVVIEAPVTVVWNTLSNSNEEHKWLKSIDVLYNYNASARQIRFMFGHKTLLVNQQVRLRENAHTIDYFQIGREKYTGLQDFSGQLMVTSLADGSAEVQWKISYTTETLSQRLVNRFSLIPKIRDLLKENLLSFKDYIEH